MNGRVLAVACAVVLVVYGLMIDLKGVDGDEGIRLGIMNGGQAFLLDDAGTHASWDQVLQTAAPYAYQPVYFLMQNTLMRVARTHDVVFLRLVNVFFLWVCLQGLIALSRDWSLAPRLFLLGLFSFNAYLFMHVLQVREYILGLAFYVWSTWFVLKLDRRELGREWADVIWFAAYGLLLTLGFYSQSWVVFPAIGQFLFLVVRRGRAKGRFYAHLALSYAVVLCFTWPYLQAHHEKVDVGRWGTEGTAFWPQLSDGFHLVLVGHASGHALFTDFLFWFWLALVAGAALLLFRRPGAVAADVPVGEFERQGLLMVLSMLVPLAFQVGYFIKVDNLSVWPRYFIIHYFFVTWLVALAFKFLCDLHFARKTRRPALSLTAVIATTAAILVASGIYQTRSYYRDPLLDTGLTPDSNWRSWAAELSGLLKPDDVLLTNDFIGRATLSFTRAMPNRMLLLQDLETSDLKSVGRVVYLESLYVKSQRAQLVARMTALGFKQSEDLPLHTADGKSEITSWRVLAFSRH